MARKRYRSEDHLPALESLRDSNPTVLMAWAFWGSPISDSRGASAEVLTATGVLDCCGAQGTRTRPREIGRQVSRDRGS